MNTECQLSFHLLKVWVGFYFLERLLRPDLPEGNGVPFGERWEALWGAGNTYPQCWVGAMLQQTLGSAQAQVGGSDVQGGAMVEVTARGVHH